MRKLMLLGLSCCCATASAGTCDSAEYRQFDFWVGNWQVTRPDGAVAGVNQITREYGGCVLHEHYQSPKGYRGESLNIYDPGRKVWHQTWVDSEGTLLLLEGGLIGHDMVLQGSTTDDKGIVTRHRITWTPNPDGSVRQHWESAGADSPWRTVFDGLYRKQ